MRGRRNDPRDEALRGYPGERKAKTDAAIRKLEQERAAAGPAVVLEALASGPPAFLRGREARNLWREYFPRLQRLRLVASELDAVSFAMLCSYAGEYLALCRELEKSGYSEARAKRRDKAASMTLTLMRRFGMTPVDRHKLIRDHAMRADVEALFARGPILEAETPTAPAKPAPQDSVEILGLLSRLDSPGPGKPN